MKNILRLLFLLGALITTSQAQLPYAIKHVGRYESGNWVFVDGNWISNLPGIIVELNVRENTEAKKVMVHAYFFDESGAIIKKFKSPLVSRHPTDHGMVEEALPKMLQKKESIPLYYPITEDVAEKWRKFVVVFGDQDVAVARSEPSGELTDVNFPEKELVLKGQAEDSSN